MMYTLHEENFLLTINISLQFNFTGQAAIICLSWGLPAVINLNLSASSFNGTLIAYDSPQPLQSWWQQMREKYQNEKPDVNHWLMPHLKLHFTLTVCVWMPIILWSKRGEFFRLIWYLLLDELEWEWILVLCVDLLCTAHSHNPLLHSILLRR